MGVLPAPVTTEEAVAEIRKITAFESEGVANPRRSQEALQIPVFDTVLDRELFASRAAELASKFFEDIYQGVYWEAYTSLSIPERIRFMNLAASHNSVGFSDSFILRELVQFCDVSSKDVFQSQAEQVRFEEPFQQEAVALWCLGIIGCARLRVSLPKWKGGIGVASQAWRLTGVCAHFFDTPLGSPPMWHLAGRKPASDGCH